MNAQEALKRTLVVIPSINGAHLLSRMLPTLRIPRDNIVVIDQVSTDDTYEICSKHSVNVVQIGYPITYTKACNIGLDLARKGNCEFIFVGNNDITFVTDVVNECLSELVIDPNLAIVAPSQISH